MQNTTPANGRQSNAIQTALIGGLAAAVAFGLAKAIS